MSAIQDLIDSLSTVVEHLQAADHRAGAAAQVTDDAQHLATAIGAARVAADLDELHDRVEDVQAALSGVRDAARDTLTLARDVNAADTAATAPIPVDRPAPATRPAEDQARPASSQDSVPGWVRDAAAGLPHRRNNKGPTHGLIADVTGAALTGSPAQPEHSGLRSGFVPGARDGLRSDWHPLAQATTEHVEAHAAALLRRPGAPRDAVLVINNPTCRSRGQYIGCDELLPGMLPQNTRLAVYVSDGQRTRLATVYTGTGEGVMP